MPESAARSPGVPPLPPDELRWACDPSVFAFETTDEIEPLSGVVGQDAAIEALQFGLECMAPGQNIYVRGLTGTGRMTLIRRLLMDINPACPLASDRVYVRNFDDPGAPRLLTLPRGKGCEFAKAMDEVVDFIRDDLAAAIGSQTFKARVQALERSVHEQVQGISRALEAKLEAAGLALVTVASGPLGHPAIFPRIKGQPVPPELYEAERAKGTISQEEYDRARKAADEHRPELERVASQIRDVMEQLVRSTRTMLENEVRTILRPTLARLRTEFDEPEVRDFLDRLLEDLLAHHLTELAEAAEFTDDYRVNPIQAHDPEDGCPAIIENVPTLSNLVGGIERPLMPGEVREPPTHMAVRGGSLLRADGGYLILEARDVLSEPGAWRALVRTLRTGKLEISPIEPPWLAISMPLKPEPIPINVKVILLGDPELFHLLDTLDPDFDQLFKVLAEFDTVIPRCEASLRQYASVVKRLVDEEGLSAFDRTAVAALVEYGSRVAASRDKLTTRFSRIADIAREASFVAGKDGRIVVNGEDVRETVRRTKRRASLASRKFRELVRDGTIIVHTRGRAVGQMNGLAVIHAGPLTYGFPARITATIGPGSKGVINIEREAALSGAIHTKGFYILGGLLRSLLRTDHPLAFDASIAFEQSYGGIDGDSASGAEICCLISALTQLPLHQDIAMTGAIDQTGNLMAIGGANEKIEGYFDACADLGLTGTQGVIIPRANAGDLMLRHDVVEACREGRFRVCAVETILQALEILTDLPAGGPDDPLDAPTILGRARAKAREFWRLSVTTKAIE